MSSDTKNRADGLSGINTKNTSAKPNGGRTGKTDLLETLATARRQLRAAEQRNARLSLRCLRINNELTLLKSALDKAWEFANYDQLTGLANRRLLLERFNQASSLGKRHHQQLLLLFLDLDDFKTVNDALGHTIGDRLIRQVAKRLCASVRASDTVCRYGGDEFVVLLTEIKNYGSALAVVEKICANLARPYDLDGIPIAMSASHGIAVYPDDGEVYGELIQQSDLEMYRCKSRKRTARNFPVDAGALVT